MLGLEETFGKMKCSGSNIQVKLFGFKNQSMLDSKNLFVLITLTHRRQKHTSKRQRISLKEMILVLMCVKQGTNNYLPFPTSNMSEIFESGFRKISTL